MSEDKGTKERRRRRRPATQEEERSVAWGHGLGHPGKKVPGAGGGDPERRRDGGEQPQRLGRGCSRGKGWSTGGVGGGKEPRRRGGDTGNRKRRGRKGIRQSCGARSQLRSTPAARRPVTPAVVVGSIPTSSARGAHLKTSIVQGSGRQYSCNRFLMGHRSTQARPDAGDVFTLCPMRAARCARVKDSWRQTGKGTKRGSGAEACSCVRSRHTMSVTEEEASVSSRE